MIVACLNLIKYVCFGSTSLLDVKTFIILIFQVESVFEKMPEDIASDEQSTFASRFTILLLLD